ncbi:outer membrane protein transport protein [Guyparkeria hydrothermalis]|uniref:OmpP1/FadL family transporter n=1 Tax=Guyparkeria hydrothermalis TaxID=923 RepID=UPI0020210102|nr:outer membrane protein transport protein [Guyparkeria hydrothermalis]MCL7743694.1 outer membrane protein transport protein [Guyparkeria hydrothermalis]
MTFKRTLLATAIAGATFASSAAYATNGYQLIGVGGYQMGMAGAVTSNPGSAMTATSNPAGIGVVQPGADFSMEAFMPERSVSLGGGAPAQDSETDLYGVPSIGWSAPVSEGSNVYFGGGMYATSGLGVDYLFPADDAGNTTFQGYSQLGVFQMSPALAVKVDNRLTIGGALNIGYMQLGFKQGITSNADGSALTAGDIPGQPLPPAYVDMSQSANAFGLGATLGVIYDVNDMVTVGASYRTEQKFQDLEYNLSHGQIEVQGNQMPAGRYTASMDLPQQFSVGGTIRPMEGLEISGDVKWINWAGTMDSFVVSGPNGFEMDLGPDWDDQVVYAIAADYQVTPKLAVRAGFNYGKSPVQSEQVANNLIFPAVVEQHYTAGFTYEINNHWNIGASYMYAPKETFTAPANSGQQGDMNNEQEISLEESAIVVNLGYKF